MTSDRKSVWAIFIVFFLQSAVLGNWIPRIPDLKQQLGLTDGSLGLCLLAIPLGTFIGLSFAGKMIEHTGLRRACQISLPAWAIAFVFPPLAPNPFVFVVLLFVAGVAVGMVEVAMNTEADRIEQHIKKRIMSRCHGFWSLGSMVGALMGGALAQVGLSVATHFAIVMPILALIGWWTASQLPRVGSVNANQEDAPLFRLPSRAIILLCILPMGAMVVEGAFIDWSGVFMRSILDASPLIISITYSYFAIVMATVRLFGDAIGERVAARTIVQCSGVASAIGISVFALAPNLIVAYIGAAISGIGVAIVYPLAVTAAARRPGRSSADNVAAITMISFTAFMIAPPLIGFLSEAFGLRIALLMLAPVAITTALLSAEVSAEK